MNDHIEIASICQIARDAGAEILTVYDSDFDFEAKGDGSPLTLADKKAHTLIETQLKALTPDIPVLSEESFEEIGDTRLSWPLYWLVDPLDGTKEFIKRNGEFTVNIALISEGIAIMGVVYAPVRDELYYAEQGEGAFRQNANQAPLAMHCRALDTRSIKIVASRSHLSDEVQQFVQALKKRADTISLINMGSSLKLCLVAAGEADFYPRLGLTSEWDTAAAQCVVEAAGGQVLDCQGMPLRYSKKNILNPWFLVIADPSQTVNCEGHNVGTSAS